MTSGTALERICNTVDDLFAGAVTSFASDEGYTTNVYIHSAGAINA